MRPAGPGLAAVLVAAHLAFVAPSAAGEAAPGKAAPAAPSASQAAARKILDRMAAYLAARKDFHVDMLVDYEVLQKSGQKIEFSEIRSVSVERPGRLRIEKLGSDGKGSIVLLDGREMLVVDLAENVYAAAPQPGPVDQSIVRLVRDLGLRVPLAPLVMETLPKEMEGRVTDVDYVEWTPLLGDPCHHIAGRTSTVDFEMWISDDEDEPLLRKITLTYRYEPGMPRFRAEFDEWDIDDGFRRSEFELDLPKDARKIPFATELARENAPAAPAKEQ